MKNNIKKIIILLSFTLLFVVGNKAFASHGCTILSFTANNATNITVPSASAVNLSWTTSGTCSHATLFQNSQSYGSASIPTGNLTVYPTISTSYLLGAHDVNGFSVAKTVKVNVTQPVSCTIQSFTANGSSSTTIQSGNPVNLVWNTSGCVSVSVSGPNLSSNNINGNKMVNLTSLGLNTYTIVAYGTNPGLLSQTVNVTVNQSSNPSTSCSVQSFTANGSSSITVQANTAVNLVWSTSNCTSVSVSGPNINTNNSLNGNQTIYPSSLGLNTYTIVAYGTNPGLVSQSVNVTVSSNSNPNNNCYIQNFTANGSSSVYIQSGDPVNLVWNTSGCNSVNVSGPIYSNNNLSGNATINPTYSGTYTITAYGSNSQTQTQSVYVNVNNNNNQYNNCYIRYFTVDGSSSTTIQSGDPVRIEWDTNNCSSVYVSGPNYNSSSSNGNRTIYPTYSGTYTITAYGSYSGTQTQRVYVNVNNYYNNNNYYYNNCTISYFSASPTSVNYGGLSTLSWSTSNCSSVSISNIGSVNSYGSHSIYPTYTTTYTLSAYGSNNGYQSRSITIYVNNYMPSPTPVYNTCAVTSVATNVSSSSVTLNGIVTNSNSGNTYFEYGREIVLGSQTNSKSVSSNNSFSDTVTGLSPNTIYYYRLVANCANGISRGSINVFQTTGGTGGDIEPITNTRTIIRQGTTVIGDESPIMLKIENRNQSIKVDDKIDYTVTYKNIGSKKLINPILQVILPKGVAYLNSSRGTYSSDTYTLTVPIEDLDPNAKGEVYLQGQVDSIDGDNAQIVTTALLVYTNTKGAQENVMAYVLNNPLISTDDNNNTSLTASAIFGNIFKMGMVGWLLLLILILLAILLFRKIYRKQ